MLALGQRAGLAIQNARLYEQAQAAAAAEERQRLARELHDAVTQTLFSASLIAEVAPKVWDRNPTEGRRRMEELRLLTRGALAEMRALLEAAPAAGREPLTSSGPTGRCGRLALAIGDRRRGARRRAQVPSDLQIGLYRVAQEALNNCTEHAQAATRALLTYAAEFVRRVEDDGVGHLATVAAPADWGAGIMAERTRAVGATHDIQSRSGHRHDRPLARP